MPVVRGAGSISSPIIISDDEDEALVEAQLNAADSDSSLTLAKAGDLKEATGQNVEVFATCSTTPDVHISSSVVQTVGYSMALRMGFRPGCGLGLQFDVEPLSFGGLKRKRHDGGIGFPGTPQNSGQEMNSEADVAKKGNVKERRKKRKQEPPVSSPKAKLVNHIPTLPPKPAKAHKVEKVAAAKGKGRQAASVHQLSRKQYPASMAASEYLPAPSSFTQTPIRRDPFGSSGPRHLLPPPSETEHFSSAPNSFPDCPPFTGPGIPELWKMQCWLGNAAPSYVPWQDFLNPVASEPMDQPDHTPSTSYSPNVPPEPGASIFTKDPLLHRPKGKNFGLSSMPKAVPQRPKATLVTLVIGCSPEAGSQSGRGNYSKSLPKQPSPACTLVLDSIPQRYRTLPWVTNWASIAGQVTPMQVDVDTNKGKALIEFPDAVAARKAFISKQLRGKGRQAIRAWWYRVSGVGLKSSGIELEEGEIEDASTLKPMTRKQRKRLKAQHAATSRACGGEGVVPKHSDPPHMTSASPPPPSSGAEPSLDEQVQLEDFGGQWNDDDIAAVGNSDDMSIASSIPPSIQCVTPCPEDPEGMVMSSPVTIHSPTPHPSFLPLVSATVARNPTEGPREDPRASATIVDNTLVLSSSMAPSSVSFFPVPQLSVPQVAQASMPRTNTPSPGPSFPVDSQSPPRTPPEPRSLETSSITPSFTRHSLLARRKELEDKIAQSKTALAMTRNQFTPSCTPNTSSSTKNTPLVLEPQSSLDRLMREQDLRRLVVESKKNKRTLPDAIPPDAPNSTPVLISTPTPVITKPIFSTLEDLAVSFITESIETVKQPVRKAAALNERQELALKQERLERCIFESKALMTKLSHASNKVEKESILKAMRECTRTMELDKAGFCETNSLAVAEVKPAAFCWPSSCQRILSGGWIFFVSGCL
ncbi:hypothetical protein PAXRUDRAFT_292952 [Paxillus rubicundulus Ve08.2h10]|uniref:G-patch domain-containing protein n=1 Tax=Paxillus rubicundulus Ve08.2h10 TaxID=930991 RepID=A0A0D0E090_9AGAM|nr:hypothetical protein PAXRUDRAFT_292952 [Paxillus rubicundulus Ve08.2h10]